jgi:toxin ParE1/3/4
MKVRWTAEAADDLKEISEYLWLNHPSWAQSTLQTIYQSAMALRHQPALGRPAQDGSHRRELYLNPLPYFCTYRLEANAVSILQVRHTSREASVHLQ